MTQYSDVPQVNDLYIEQEQVQAAITLIDSGGTLTAFTLSPPPLPPFDPDNPPPPPLMTVRIVYGGTVQQSTMDAVRAQLVTRSGEINDELASLGVTSSPAALV